jgi:phospho-N-acetylmuramoyl-pentapeptide-transferase
MLYYLFKYLDSVDIPGAGVFQYLSFRAALAVIISLLISMVFGKKLIGYLRKKQVGETIRDLGLEGEKQKQGTPTMGGLIILAAILIPTLLLAKLENVYILLMIFTTIGLGAIGFVDDYIKVFKKDKKGLAGKFKVVGQIGVGLVVGAVLYFNNDVTVMTKSESPSYVSIMNDNEDQVKNTFNWEESKSMITTIPFMKNNEFDYASLISWAGDGAKKYGWILFIPLVIIIVTAVSNGANITDGLDGLATGTSAIIGVTLAVFAYVSGNFIFADYLNIMYIPQTGELVIFISAFIGACVGFLWYNSYPAQVFMGDTEVWH